MYQVIEGQEGVTFPFPENSVTLSEHTSQEDLKRVYEHSLGPGFVQLKEQQQPVEVSVDPATEAVATLPPTGLEADPEAEPKSARQKGVRS